ncbi:hypothetical protein M758_5G084500 [Ceratodon purpureus]|nr:hypothetical protein M758_5G084500 [Ceratodon purpureus]
MYGWYQGCPPRIRVRVEALEGTTPSNAHPHQVPFLLKSMLEISIAASVAAKRWAIPREEESPSVFQRHPILGEHFMTAERNVIRLNLSCNQFYCDFLFFVII